MNVTETGNSFFPLLPLDWPLMALGNLYKQVDERAGTAASEMTLLSVSQYRGIVPRDEIAEGPPRATDLSTYKVCQASDVVLNRMSAYNGAVGVARCAGLVSPDYMVMRVDGRIAPEFMVNVLKTPAGVAYMTSLVRGIGGVDVTAVRTPRINHRELRDLRVPLPPIEEQRLVLSYLDRETAKIDTLIAKQLQLIERLLERRSALAELALSRLAWSVPLGSAMTLVQSGPFGSQLSADEYVAEGTPVINPAHLVGGVIAPDPRVAVSESKAYELRRHGLHRGDVIAARRGDLGRCARVDHGSAGYICGTGCVLMRPAPSRCDPEFLQLVFASRRSRDALVQASVGSTMDNLNAKIIARLRIPLPSVEEQRSIAATTRSQVAEVDRMVGRSEALISVSRERRAALITAAVSGQVDVRAMAAS